MPSAILEQNERRRAIARLLDEHVVSRQTELVALLRAEGYLATQSSVSRDLRDLGAAKLKDGYSLPKPAETPDEESLSVVAEFVRDIEEIQISSPVMKINLATDELPRYAALEEAGADLTWGQHGGVHIAPSIDYLQQAYEDARVGKPSDKPFFSVHAQSAVDRTLAPEGKHTISIFTQYFPYALADGTWDERRDEIAHNVITEFARFAPNIPDAIVGMQVLAPPDIEARFGMTGGHIFHGELVPEQAFDLRPVPGSSSYEGPIGGLFLCGSGAWPGGCVMGAPGHNAAHEVIARFQEGRVLKGA